MKNTIAERFDFLLNEGEELVKALPLSGTRSQMSAPKGKEPIYRSWLMSSANLIQSITQPGSYFIQQVDKIFNDGQLAYFVPTRIAQQMYGLLRAAKNEWDQGLLRKIEYVFIAETFDDFLDHAAKYHKGNKKIEASVLACAVLEDTLKKISSKNEIVKSGLSLEQLIDELVKESVFTPVKSKRVKGYSGVRNSALHAEWDEFDISDVGQLIKGVRELIDEFL